MEQLLHNGLTALGLPTAGIPSLLRYGEMLVEKNKVMNLTAITEPDQVASLHMLDSAAILRYVNLFGFNPKYGVSGKPIGSITYKPQRFDPPMPLYET